jgi:predicted nucleic acid-binding protein
LLNKSIEYALEIACKFSIYAYDAYYLETASRLHLPLLTLDVTMKMTAKNLKLKVIGEKNGNRVV